jgi:4-aminobutyrate aminotransferase
MPEILPGAEPWSTDGSGPGAPGALCIHGFTGNPTSMRPVAEATPWIAEMRGRGLMWAFEVCQPGTIEPDKARTGELHEACRRHGVLVGKGGLYGNVVRLSPMLNVTQAELDDGIAAIQAAIAEVT